MMGILGLMVQATMMGILGLMVHEQLGGSVPIVGEL
jgi:hypothetical protein